MIGKIMYAGPFVSTQNSSNCPAAPDSPTADPYNMEFRSSSNFQCAFLTATIANGIIVKDHTTYPNVAGNGGWMSLSGISINAPQTPQSIGTSNANHSHLGSLICVLPAKVLAPFFL